MVTLHGGHAAFVAEADLYEGSRAVIKIGVPNDRGELRNEATVLRLANGEGCARLLRDDLDRDALLLERLGPALYGSVADVSTRHDVLCELASNLWRPVDRATHLPTGADRAREYAEHRHLGVGHDLSRHRWPPRAPGGFATL